MRRAIFPYLTTYNDIRDSSAVAARVPASSPTPLIAARNSAEPELEKTSLPTVYKRATRTVDDDTPGSGDSKTSPQLHSDQDLAHSFTMYEHVVGGHHMMLSHNGRLWKAARSTRERHFYEEIWTLSEMASAAEMPSTLLRSFVPRYYGTTSVSLKCLPVGGPSSTTSTAVASPAASVSVVETSPTTPLECGTDTTEREPSPSYSNVLCESENSTVDMLVLEDVCFGFKHPCVLDVKIGSRQYGLRPSAAKKRSKERKSLESTSGQHGIRLAGYKRWNEATQQYECKTKLELRPISYRELSQVVCDFVTQGYSGSLRAHFSKLLQDLRSVFLKQKKFRFYTSSLLLVYDAENPVATARLTMVDFAYTYTFDEVCECGEAQPTSLDEEYIKALDSLVVVLENISCSARTSSASDISKAAHP